MPSSNNNRFKTKIRLDNSKVYQNGDDELTLSGDTTVYGDLVIDNESGGTLKILGVTDPENKFLKLNSQGVVEPGVVEDGIDGYILENGLLFSTTLTGDRREKLRGLNGLVFTNPSGNGIDYTTIGINKIIEFESKSSAIVSDGIDTYDSYTYIFKYKDYTINTKREVRFYYVNDVLKKKQYKDPLINGNDNIIEETYNYTVDNEFEGITYDYDVVEWIGE